MIWTSKYDAPIFLGGFNWRHVTNDDETFWKSTARNWKAFDWSRSFLSLSLSLFLTRFAHTPKEEISHSAAVKKSTAEILHIHTLWRRQKFWILFFLCISYPFFLPILTIIHILLTHTSPTGSPVYFLKNTIFLLLLLFPPSSSIPLANYGGRLEISFSLFLTFPMCLDFSTYNNITCTYGFFFWFWFDSDKGTKAAAVPCCGLENGGK